MRILTEQGSGDVAVFEAGDGLNGEQAEEFAYRIEQLSEGGLRKVVVDCTRLDHVSSYGLGVLIRIHHRMRRRGGHVKLANVQPSTLQALEMTRLDRTFELYDDVATACAAFAGVSRPTCG